MNFQRFSCLCFPSPRRHIGIIDVYYCIWLYVGLGNPSSNLQFCTMRALPTGQPPCCFILFSFWRQGLSLLPRMVWNSQQSPCLSLLHARIKGMRHHAQLWGTTFYWKGSLRVPYNEEWLLYLSPFFRLGNRGLEGGHWHSKQWGNCLSDPCQPSSPAFFRR